MQKKLIGIKNEEKKRPETAQVKTVKSQRTKVAPPSINTGMKKPTLAVNPSMGNLRTKKVDLPTNKHQKIAQGGSMLNDHFVGSANTGAQTSRAKHDKIDMASVQQQ